MLQPPKCPYSCFLQELEFDLRIRVFPVSILKQANILRLLSDVNVETFYKNFDHLSFSPDRLLVVTKR